MDGLTTNESVIVSGLSHKGTVVSVRERFSLSDEHVGRVLKEIASFPEVEEAVVISTCNRLEVIGAAKSDQVRACENRFEEYFEVFSGIPRASFSPGVYHLAGEQAVSHLFRVAAGLDSLVVGEPQILGQLKDAYRYAQREGTTHAILHRLFNRAFGVAKTIRTNTNVGRRAVSVCYAARELAGHIFGNLQGASVLIFGAGAAGELALRHFVGAGVKQVFIVNRTLERGVSLAEEYGAVPLSLDNYRMFLDQADIVIGASGVDCGMVLVTKEDVSAMAWARHGRPQFFVDLGVPRNFDPEIGTLNEAFLYNIDDLEATVKANLNARALDVQEAELIISDEARKFSHWLDARVVDLTIGELMSRCEEFESMELQKTLRRLKTKSFTDEQLGEINECLNAFSKALLGKTLHQPVTELKRRTRQGDDMLRLFRRLFLGDKR